MRNPQAYEHSYTVWKKARKEFKLCDDDKEPDFVLFGLSEWEAGKIKERINKEMDRPA